MPLYWLCYRHNNQISVVIEPGASLIHARLQAALAGLDQGKKAPLPRSDRCLEVFQHRLGLRAIFIVEKTPHVRVGREMLQDNVVPLVLDPSF